MQEAMWLIPCSKCGREGSWGASPEFAVDCASCGITKPPVYDVSVEFRDEDEAKTWDWGAAVHKQIELVLDPLEYECGIRLRVYIIEYDAKGHELRCAVEKTHPTACTMSMVKTISVGSIREVISVLRAGRYLELLLDAYINHKPSVS